MENGEDINDRILFLMKYLKLSKAAFADSIEINPSVLSHIASKRNKPSIDMVMSIVRVYPKVSGDWLLTGLGVMFKDESSSNLKSIVNDSIAELQLLHDVNYQSYTSRLKSIANRLDSLV